MTCSVVMASILSCTIKVEYINDSRQVTNSPPPPKKVAFYKSVGCRMVLVHYLWTTSLAQGSWGRVAYLLSYQKKKKPPLTTKVLSHYQETIWGPVAFKC